MALLGDIFSIDKLVLSHVMTLPFKVATPLLGEELLPSSSLIDIAKSGVISNLRPSGETPLGCAAVLSVDLARLSPASLLEYGRLLESDSACGPAGERGLEQRT